MGNELLKLDNQLCFRLYAVSRKMTRLYQPLLEPYHITYPQYIVMLVLFEKERIDFKALSHIVYLSTGTLTPIVQNLEKVGYLIRETNVEDKRKMNVVLSETGRKLQQQIIDVPLTLASNLEISEDMYNVITKELDALSELLNKVKIK